jgi:ribokinase
MIHVIGNAAVDTVIRLDCLPRPGETIVARGAADDLGGKGANQAVVVARCGQEVRLAAAVGADALGLRIQSTLAAAGVETDCLRTWPGSTDRCLIYVDRLGENTIVSLIDAAHGFDPIAETAIERWIAPGDWVVMQGNLRASVTRDCLALAKARGATTALNPSPTYPAADYDWTLVDLVVLNRGEAIELGGRCDPLDAVRTLLAAGAGAVVITLGAEGSALVSTTETLRAKATEVTAIDTVGAGDVFCGTLVAARAAGLAWAQALRAASDAAAICVTRAGVLASFPSRLEMAGILPTAPRHVIGEHVQ